MRETQAPDAFFAACSLDPAVIELRSNYRGLLFIVDDLGPNAVSSATDELISRAEARARIPQYPLNSQLQ